MKYLNIHGILVGLLKYRTFNKIFNSIYLYNGTPQEHIVTPFYFQSMKIYIKNKKLQSMAAAAH